eukprot:13787299-Alexandrium_andersonii.AAC.1
MSRRSRATSGPPADFFKTRLTATMEWHTQNPPKPHGGSARETTPAATKDHSRGRHTYTPPTQRASGTSKRSEEEAGH